jgi:hypothetical protein
MGVERQNEDPRYQYPAVYWEISQKIFFLMWQFLFMTNVISDYSKRDIVFRFKCMPYLIGVFKIVRYFLLA